MTDTRTPTDGSEDPQRAVEAHTRPRREAILNAAIEQLILRGIASVRVSDVAAACGISTGLVHYHFATKDQLVAEAFAFEAHRDLSAMSRIMKRELSALERLQLGMELYGPGRDAPGWRIWIDGWSESLRNDQLRGVIRRLNKSWADATEKLILEGAEDGSFQVTHARASARRLLALIDGLSVRAVLWPEEPGAADVRSWVRETIRAELRHGMS